MLLGGEESEFNLLHLALAGTHIHFAAFDDLGGAEGMSFSKAASAFSYLPCCNELDRGLVMLKSGPCARGGVDAGMTGGDDFLRRSNGGTSCVSGFARSAIAARRVEQDLPPVSCARNNAARPCLYA